MYTYIYVFILGANNLLDGCLLRGRERFGELRHEADDEVALRAGVGVGHAFALNQLGHTW